LNIFAKKEEFQAVSTSAGRRTHAGANLITQCAKFGIRAEGSTLYVNTSPCSLCMKLLVNVGVRKIVYRELYEDELALEIAREAGLEMVKFVNG